MGNHVLELAAIVSLVVLAVAVAMYFLSREI
jgi:hypothetical protein